MVSGTMIVINPCSLCPLFIHTDTAQLRISVCTPRQKSIIDRKGFLWRLDMDVPEVRDRSLLDNASKKIEWVAPEEIRQAIYEAVDLAFSLSPDDAASSAARMLGFQRLTAQMKKVFEVQLSKMINANLLEMRDGLVFVNGP